MPAKTAWLHLDSLPGYIPLTPRGESRGLARCYRLSEPADFDGDGISHEYVIVRILYPSAHMAGEVAVFPGTVTGGVPEGSLKRRIGSFCLSTNPKGDSAAIEYAIALAFAFNNFEVVEPPEPEPEPEPELAESEFPEGLDYNPDEVPDYE